MRITASDWGWRHAGRRNWAVQGLDLSIEAGERVLLLGASGAGKSTLLHALAGVLGGPDEGTEAGSLLLDGRHPTRQRGRVALVLQDPDSQVILSRVGDDVAFGLENLGTDPSLIWPRVDDALAAVGLAVGRDRDTSHLSGGEKQRLALAGALAMRPDVLLLDEPTANLDPEGVLEVRRAVAVAASDAQRTLVVVEHRVDVWADLVDRVIVLAAGGGVLADGHPDEVFASHREALLAAGVWVPGEALPPPPPPAPDGDWLLRAEGLDIGRLPGRPVQRGLSLSLDEGCSSVVTGPNGAGKSTLALTLAGLLPPLGGTVSASAGLRPQWSAPNGRLLRRRTPRPADPGSWRSRDLLTRIGTVFQDPEHQLVTGSVRDELAVGLRALEQPEATVTATVDRLLAELRLTSLAGANPFTLSGGEKRRLSVGTMLATAPRVVFLDEPTFGQDRNTWLSMTALVADLVRQGHCVVSVTHDADFIATVGQRELRLDAA